jgi:polysaccharide biosynthesis protein VpsM
MSRKDLVAYRFLAVLSVVLLSGWSIAGAVVKLSKLELTPYLGLQSQMDDNIYLQQNGRQSSEINSVTPGLNLYLPVEDHQFSLMWHSDLIEYTENPTNNNAINNYVSFSTKLNFPVGVFLNASDDWISTTDPLTTEQIERTKRLQNNFTGEIGYKFADRYTVKAGYTQTLHDYLLEAYKQPLNRRESVGSVELAYNFSPKTSVLVDYGIGVIDYAFASNPNSSSYNQYRLGVKGQLTPKTIGEIKLGALDKTYQDLTDKNIALGVLEMSTLTKFSDKMSLMLGANRSDVESTFTNNNYYITTAGSVDLKRKILKNWSFDVNGTYADDAYPNAALGLSAREDTYVQAGISLNYEAIKWLVLSAGYNYKDRDSNIDIYDYADNLIGISAKLTY